jgi:hypothetical protein
MFRAFSPPAKKGRLSQADRDPTRLNFSRLDRFLHGYKFCC